ncbi:MAG: transporter substrate-binding domain-containing protein [Oleispira sp.]|nr:transporter substrate-binding domain-containing protein [Oleispira sp.]MBL4882731.1 transporter substrate-binding domain-containing protein [Oleispira sp.]
MKFLIAIIGLIFSSTAFSQPPIKVTVGMYPFAPFVEQDDFNGTSGMTIDLIAALNRNQKKYHFETILIPPKRRYQSYKRGDYDVIFYENLAWGWQDYPVDISNIYQKGGEVYVALKQSGRGQEYFDSFDNKRMMGILGFHYGFANFNADEKFLHNKFNMTLSHDNDKNLTKLLKQRGDVVVVTKAYLQRYLKYYPGVKESLLISEKLDQEYNHTVLLRPNSEISIKEINEMLDDLTSSGEMTRLFDKYGISQH